jgi:hypothetical protein
MWITVKTLCPRRLGMEKLRSTTSSWVCIRTFTDIALLITNNVFFFSVHLVVGQEELDARSVNVRNRDDVGTKSKGEMVPLDKVVDQLVALKNSRSLANKLL